MFWVTNKDRLVSVGIALSTVLVLFLLAATFKTQNIGTSIQTSAKTSKMLPIYNVDTEENYKQVYDDQKETFCRRTTGTIAANLYIGIAYQSLNRFTTL